MSILTRLAAVVCVSALGACAATPGEDYGFDSKKLTSLSAATWVDPYGCEHWIISDGAEGYMTPRRSRDGRPVCSGVNQRGAVNPPTVTAKAAIFTDPRGCQHWVFDAGAEGFMSERLDRTGAPVCPGVAKPAPAPQTITLAADALFDTDKSDLRPEAVAELNDFGQKMNQLGKTRVFIVGHTDARASDGYNQGLSERRAASVAAYLEQNFGITGQTEGRGEREPVAPNDTPANLQRNRRVEITLLD